VLPNATRHSKGLKREREREQKRGREQRIKKKRRARSQGARVSGDELNKVQTDNTKTVLDFNP
jgi:ribosome assembly protein YihI (activator of Der GTPase)